MSLHEFDIKIARKDGILILGKALSSSPSLTDMSSVLFRIYDRPPSRWRFWQQEDRPLLHTQIVEIPSEASIDDLSDLFFNLGCSDLPWETIFMAAVL